MTTGGHERCPGGAAGPRRAGVPTTSALRVSPRRAERRPRGGRRPPRRHRRGPRASRSRSSATWTRTSSASSPSTLIAWRRSVRQHPETWSVDVDRAAVLVTRARATPPRPGGCSPAPRWPPPPSRASSWCSCGARPARPRGLPMRTRWRRRSDLDRASEALERGDLSEARIALTRAERRLPAEPQDDTARRLQVRYRALQDEVDAGTSHRGAGHRVRGPGPHRGARLPGTRRAARRPPRRPGARRTG